MEVAYFQIVVAVTILIAFIFNKKLGYGVSLAWMVFTISSVVTMPLLTVQFGTILVTTVLCNKFQSGRKRERKLQESNQQLERKLDSLLSDYEIFRNSYDKNRDVEIISSSQEHRTLLFDSIGLAKDRVIILSGFLTDFAFDRKFREALSDALKKGVNIYIGYGYREKRNFLKTNQTKLGEKNLRDLQEWCATINTQGRLVVRDYRNHAKLLMVDEKYAVCGSFNWLSNSGAGWNEELSFKLSSNKISILADKIITDFENAPSNRRRFLNKIIPWSDHD